MIPYGRQLIEDRDVEAVARTLRSDWLTQGPEVPAFEADLAARVNARHVIAVSSGTAALHLACIAAGVTTGDVVVTSAITFVASANCAVYCGADVALADVDDASVTLDPNALRETLGRLRGRTIRAVVPVDFAGQPADIEAIGAAAREIGAVVIEDACHSLGAEWRDGSGVWRRVGDGTSADMTVFSFHPVKHVTTGEGGAIATNSGALADRLRLLRTHGITRDPALLRRNEGPWYYEMQALGFNYRITDIQCALGRSQLTRLQEWVERRRSIARRYDEAFAGVQGITPVGQRQGARSAYHLYVIRLDGKAYPGGRARLFAALRERGLGVQVHYIPIHYQPFYADRFGFRSGDFPSAERYYAEAISLPMFPALTDADVAQVIGTVRGAVEELTTGVGA
jgi:UDP-4-amino-4,6-dideoxy-N-acetyl-beta-L-altrosamine transaminase